MSLQKTLLTALLASSVAVLSTPTLAAAAPDDQPRSSAGSRTFELPREVREALQRDLGLSEEQVRKHGAQQAEAVRLDRELRASLGAALAGSFYDARTGKLTVLVSDADKVDDAEARGAEARTARRSRAQLEAVKAELDRDAGKADSASATSRKANGPRKASMAGITSWFVDDTTNSVRVTVEKARSAQARERLARYGDAVTITESADVTSPTVYMDGGDLINSSSCSAGFNLRNPSTGQGYLLTAGHCVTAGSTLRGQGGAVFGRVLESWFPTYDDALARNDSAGHFVQGPWVDYNPSNGGYITVSGYTDAPVGTTVCKSGITTKWTCGYIRAKNESVTYAEGTVHGLTRHSACVEKGDSGGSTVSVTSRYAAEGVTSGARLRSDGTRLRCLSHFGLENVSWHYPIADSLAYYGPKYGVQVW